MQQNVLAVLSPATSSRPAVVANLIRKPECCALCGKTAQAGSRYAICPDCYKVNGSFFAAAPLPGETIRKFAARRRLASAILRGVHFEKFPRAFDLKAMGADDTLPFAIRERAWAQLHRRQPKPQPEYRATARDRAAWAPLMRRFATSDAMERFVENLIREDNPYHPHYDAQFTLDIDVDVRRVGPSATLHSRSYFGPSILEKHGLDGSTDRRIVRILTNAISSDLPYLSSKQHEADITRWLQALRRSGRRVPKDALQLSDYANGKFKKQRKLRSFIGYYSEAGSFHYVPRLSRAPLESAWSSRRYGRTIEPGTLRLSDAALV